MKGLGEFYLYICTLNVCTSNAVFVVHIVYNIKSKINLSNIYEL